MFRRLNCIKSVRNFKTYTIDVALKDVKTQAKALPQLEMPEVITKRDYKYKEGQIYHGFQCERIEHCPDYELMSCSLRHVVTGTEYWHLDRNDINNTFAINFRTPPIDSTGTPHILEHTTLCGSKKFPIRNLFFKMHTRSVTTHMNATTLTDLTLYHFASRNEVDFRNLMQIYCDCVFEPNLLYLDFLQEGWRLEHKDLHDPKSELMFKGVVFNEMKGSFSDNTRICRQNIFNNLLPNNAYKHTTGGDPLCIPTLTHEALIEYHRKYYHPSNALLYSYGSFDLMKTLSFLDEEYLSKRAFQDTSFSIVPPQPRWTEPRRIHCTCRLDKTGAAPELQNQIAIAFLMCDRTEVQECFELWFLTDLLIRGPNAPFYKGMVEQNFSGGFNKNTRYAFTARDTNFRVGLQDLRVEDFGKFIETFDRTVNKVVREGFDSQHMESCLHNLEMLVRHQIPDLGRVLLFNSVGVWNHGGDAFANLCFTEQKVKLMRHLKENKNYLQDKVKQYILNNPHKLIMTMSADEKYDESLEKAQAAMLKEKVASLTKEDLEKIYQDGLKLKAAQNAPINLEALPCVSLKDVEMPMIAPALLEEHIQDVPTQLCKVNTSGITYINCMLNMTGLSPEDAKLVPLLCHVIKNMGTRKYNFGEFDKLVQLKTAGINFEVKIVENVKDYNQYQMGLLMTTYALDQNVPDMFAVCEELMLNFKLEDVDRLKMLIDTYISNLTGGITITGHLLVMKKSAALISNAAQLKSQLTGVDHIDCMREFVNNHSTEEIREKLKNIGSKLFSKSNMRVAINTSEDFASAALEHYNTFLYNLPTAEKMKDRNDLCLLEPGFQHYELAIPINFCAKAFYAVPYLHEDHPVLRVISKIVMAKYLMAEVRDKNGAYSTAARIGYDGIFFFYSYRDPHSTKTLEVFDKTYEWLLANKNKFDEESLFEAKLGVLQLVDWPLGPGEMGLDYFTVRVSLDDYVNYRNRLLAVTIDQVHAAIDKYFVNEPKHVGKCILGPKMLWFKSVI